MTTDMRLRPVDYAAAALYCLLVIGLPVFAVAGLVVALGAPSVVFGYAAQATATASLVMFVAALRRRNVAPV